jgi:hypothetical protein
LKIRVHNRYTDVVLTEKLRPLVHSVKWLARVVQCIPTELEFINAESYVAVSRIRKLAVKLSGTIFPIWTNIIIPKLSAFT